MIKTVGKMNLQSKLRIRQSILVTHEPYPQPVTTIGKRYTYLTVYLATIKENLA